MWLVDVRNDGEAAVCTAKYVVRGPAVEGWAIEPTHYAIWGTLTRYVPPQTEITIPKGDRGQIQLAESGEDPPSGNYPPGTVVRFVRVVGSNRMDRTEPYAQRWVGTVPASCVVRLRVLSRPSTEAGGVLATYVVGPDGVRPPRLDIATLELLLESRAPHERVRTAREWFTELVLAAKTGDAEARQKFPDLCRVFMNASRAYGGSGPTFEADYQLVRQAQEELALGPPAV